MLQGGLRNNLTRPAVFFFLGAHMTLRPYGNHPQRTLYRLDVWNLMQVMLSRGESMSSLAEQLGVTRQAVSLWLKTDRLVPEKMVDDLERVLRTPKRMFSSLLLTKTTDEELAKIRQMRRAIGGRAKRVGIGGGRDYNRHNKAGSFVVLGGDFEGDVKEDNAAG